MRLVVAVALLGVVLAAGCGSDKPRLGCVDNGGFFSAPTECYCSHPVASSEFAYSSSCSAAEVGGKAICCMDSGYPDGPTAPGHDGPYCQCGLAEGCDSSFQVQVQSCMPLVM